MGRCRLGGRGVSIRYPDSFALQAGIARINDASCNPCHSLFSRIIVSTFFWADVHTIYEVERVEERTHWQAPGVLSIFGLLYFFLAMPLGERISDQVHRSDREDEKEIPRNTPGLALRFLTGGLSMTSLSLEGPSGPNLMIAFVNSPYIRSRTISIFDLRGLTTRSSYIMTTIYC